MEVFHLNNVPAGWVLNFDMLQLDLALVNPTLDLAVF